MPQDIGEHEDATGQDAIADWVWDLGLRRIRYANAPARALWGAETEIELATRVFGPSDPMTRAGEEAAQRLDETHGAPVTLRADIAGRHGLELICIRATAAPHLLRFTHQMRAAPPEPTPDAFFAAAPFAMAILSPEGAVLRENPAAEALLGADAGADWSDRHQDRAAAAQAVRQAVTTGGASYTARLSVLGGWRRLSVNLSRLDATSPEAALLASITPIPDADVTILGGNPAEEVLHAAPCSVLVFSPENEQLAYANASAIIDSDAFGPTAPPPPNLEILFPEDVRTIRTAFNALFLDVHQRPRRISIRLPGGGDAMVAADATIGFWRGAAAYFLWVWRRMPVPIDAAPVAEPPQDPDDRADDPAAAADTAPQPAPQNGDGAAAATAAQIGKIARARLIAEASHALRTSATSIQGFAEMELTSRDGTNEYTERLRAIKSASEQLSETLETFLAELMEQDQA